MIWPQVAKFISYNNRLYARSASIVKSTYGTPIKIDMEEFMWHKV